MAYLRDSGNLQENSETKQSQKIWRSKHNTTATYPEDLFEMWVIICSHWLD